VKVGAVRWNVIFAAKNIVRDLITNNFQAKHQSAIEGVTSPFYWLGVAFLHHAAKENWPIMKNFKGKLNELVTLYEKNGGNMNSYFHGSKGGVKKIYKMLEKKHVADPKKGGVLGFLDSSFKFYIDTIALSDIGPRLAEFYGVLKEYGYYVNKNGEMVYILDEDGNKIHGWEDNAPRKTPPEHIVVRARAAAADVTTNFGRDGAWGKYYSQETVFLGASIQGFDKMFRTIGSEYKRLKEAKELGEFGEALFKSRVMWATVVSMGLEIAYYMSRADDDDFITQPWWQRFNYWTLTNGHGKPVVWIPKGYGWSVVGNSAHAVWHSFYTKDPEAMKELFLHTLKKDVPFWPANVWERFVPGTLAWETASNRSLFFGQPIERQDVSRRPVHLRYNEDTDWLMRNLGNVTGRTVNISPAKLQHIINSISGGMYKRFSRTAHNIKTAEWSGKGAAEFIRDEFFLYKTFHVKKDYSRDTGDFYERRTEVRERAEAEKLKTGEVTLETQIERNTLELYAGLFTDIRKFRREVEEEEKFKYDRLIIGGCRDALGREPLGRYPNPFAMSPKDMPKEVRPLVSKIIKSQRDKATKLPPTKAYERYDNDWTRTINFWDASRRGARRWLLTQRLSRAKEIGNAGND